MVSSRFEHFRNQNLRGRSFKNQDLTNTDFSHSDIQGADFTGANLTGANFSYVKAGFSPRWIIGMVIIVAILGIIAGVGAAIVPYCSSLIFIRVPGFHAAPPDQPPKSIDLIHALLMFLFIVSANTFFLILNWRQGIQKALGSVFVALALGIPLIGILAGIATASNTWTSPLRQFRIKVFIGVLTNKDDAVGTTIVIYLIATLIATIAVAIALPLAITLAEVALGKILRNLVIFETFAIATITTGIITYNESREKILQGTKEVIILRYPGLIVVATTIILAVALVLFCAYFGKRILAEDEKYTVLREIAIFILSLGGPSFRGADLTHTNFSYATLKSADFRFAKIHRSLWYNTRQLNWARVGETILTNPEVRDLLVTRNGYYKSYQDANLRGANLMDADLSYANLKNSDLTNATLEAANLEYANLTQVQAIQADFTNTQMTGARGLGTWNIDNTTQLDWVDCRFIYLLEDPKPETDDRERRPSSGEFAPGEFTSLFQEALNTVDLIFRNGIDWKAFSQSYKEVQVENQGIQLDIQSIENKGNGVVVVRVSVPPEAHKGKIHSQFTQSYQEMLDLAARQQQQIEGYGQQIQWMTSVINKIVDQPKSDKLVVLRLNNGDLEKGLAITAQIWSDGHRLPREFNGALPPNLELLKLYREWQKNYNAQDAGLGSRIKAQKDQITNVSKKALKTLSQQVEKSLNAWLNSEEFIPLEKKLRQYLNSTDEIRVILQTEDILVRRLPWHLWSFFADYRKAEFGLSLPVASDRVIKNYLPRNQVRILAILGHSEGINVNEDRQILENLPEAEITFLVEPTRQEFDEHLWDERGWDILCFSGHSRSENDGKTGVININPKDDLTLEQLKNALKTAIERGLQLAIFNSCDGLGLVGYLADLHIPQIIVMREIIPDLVAQEFLKNFLIAFSHGKSLYISVREARERLQSREDKFPCASWLPALCQNQAEVPQSWEEIRGNSAA
jgi:uncharacterized protein YjbI with pentapeptide repeats